LRPGRTETADPLGFWLSVPRITLDSLLFIDNTIELVPHASRLSLSFDLIAVDGAAALRERTRAVATLDRAGRVICFALDDLKPHSSILGNQPYTEPGARELPIRREWHHTAAIRAGHRPCPEECCVLAILRVVGKNLRDQWLRPLEKLCCKFIEAL